MTIARTLVFVGVCHALSAASRKTIIMILLRSRAFRWLFVAQLCSLLGIGVMTVGLALLAFELAGASGAGVILGTVFTLKMVVYVALAPVAEVLLSRFDAKRVLVMLDISRLALLLLLPLVNGLWQLALVTVAFYAASASFTPLFQAMIPHVLTDKEDYTEGLMLSRLAYTFESMISPMLAAALLVTLNPRTLFLVAALCMAGSVVALMVSPLVSRPVDTAVRRFRDRLGRGLRIYLLTPRLRGLFAMNLALSFGLSWVLVNTIVYAGVNLEDEQSYTLLMGAYGAGAGVAALSVPRLLRHVSERTLMLSGGFAFAAVSLLIFLKLPMPAIAGVWFCFGVASSWVLTPGGLVLVRSAARADHPAVFAAQFSMSHLGWLFAYPLAGWLGSTLTAQMALAVLAGLCFGISALGALIWPKHDPAERAHTHPELPDDHPHLLAGAAASEHRHVFHIDDLHKRWRH